MTTQAPEGAPQPTVQRRLRRRSDERVLAGVASGLGDYFNVDPLLIRIALVASIVFGGMGIFLYVAAWLLMPDETSDRSIAEKVIGRAGLAGGLIGGLLVLIGGIVFLSVLANVADQSGNGAFGLVFAIAVIVAGALLLRRGEPDGVVAEAPTATAEQPRVVVRRPPRPPSPLGWYVLGAVLVAVGALALLSNTTAAEIAPGQYFGVALGIIGLGLIIGAWWGHARMLIALGLVLLPFAWAAGLVGSTPMEGGFGGYRYSPTTAGEVRPEYRLVGGQIILDLTRIEPADEPIPIDASVGMGQLRVYLPEDAGAEVEAEVGAGRMQVLGIRHNGTGLSDHEVLDGDGPQFVIHLEAGLGDLVIETRQTEGR